METKFLLTVNPKRFGINFTNVANNSASVVIYLFEGFQNLTVLFLNKMPIINRVIN